MKTSFLLILSLLLFACQPKSKTPPNIVLIMADDLGYGDISCFGSDHIKTPVLDKMASEGLKFIDYHSNGAVCSPTRAALMTGNYQQRAGLEGVIYAALDKRMYGISDDQKTIAEYLKKAGYTTGAFGKWHLGYKPEFNPTHHGFDEFYGYVSGNVDYISHLDGANLYDWWHNTDTCYDKGYVTDLLTDHALQFIENNKSRPFLLYLPHEAPHFPYQGRNAKPFRLSGKMNRPQASESENKRAYKEMVEVMDENIGRVFKKLKELGLDKNTFVFFCSDNGAVKLGSNGTLNGYKGSLWEGGHRVPAIAWYPGKITAGTLTESTVLSMDVLPTLLSVAGISVPSKFDGVDFSPVMFKQNELAERPVFWRYRNQWTVRKGEWKYLKIKDNEFLFNLKNDLGEQENLIKTNEEKATELKALLEQWDSEMNQYKQQTN